MQKELTPEFIAELKALGYMNPKYSNNGELMAVSKFAFTYGLIVGINGYGYRVRYCYEGMRDCINAFDHYQDTTQDPLGPWIKAKGTGLDGKSRDDINPNIANLHF